ncbi:hypothetical protein AT15_04370 [Kosmotoga arenicorallina S304]|uniref:MobA-like NTP transferase domain-containing protein n=1 Tax=Kosmotoga arenicorallina S304 TaxID=1453497 RepID=A0A176JXJ3_9BACT|nr:nucleotidyltransferase family protein [Kosmotoga arenicorallina]OAA28442.1 hypothetical protein AT15_04370 [Kosmotoga arenicorallina S304]
MNREEIAIVILAAGGSKRFGGNKLYSPLMGKSLISYVLDEFCIEDFGEKLLVVNPDFPVKDVECQNINIIINDDYQKGLSTSLVLATKEAISRKQKGLFISLGDMPFITREDLESLFRAVQDYPDCIIAYSYNEVKGFPTYVPGKYFDRLLKLRGDKGIKQLIATKEVKVKYLQGCWRNTFDIDTPGDIEEAEKLLDNLKKLD